MATLHLIVPELGRISRRTTLDAHVLRLIVTQRALRVGRTAVGVDKSVEIQHGHVVPFHDLADPKQ